MDKLGENIYYIGSLTSGQIVEVEFDKPIKRFSVSKNNISICNSDGSKVYPFSYIGDYTFADVLGFPNKLYIKNQSSATITDCAFFIHEFGTHKNENYFSEV